jgi:soluble lytic murein transglycosylase-like protein
MSESSAGQASPESGAALRRVYVSPPIRKSGTERAGELIFEWQTRHFSPLRRKLGGFWLRARRPLVFVTLNVAVVAGVAAVVAKPEELELELARARQMLAEQVQLAERTLKAREGELELAQIELNRLSNIHEYSRRHHIPADLAASIYDIALSEGIAPALAFSLVRVESDFTRRAVSSAGAVGYTQVMPSTATWLQPGISYHELFDRDTNLRLGFRYLKMLLAQYRGDLHLALLAYNRGPGRVDNILQAGGDPSNGYSRAVFAGASMQTKTSTMPRAARSQQHP